MQQGWISLHRKIQEHWVWDDKPFSFGQAWIDMILLANHSEKRFALGSEIVTVEPGSFITSELKLADRWGWSKTKVRRFLMLLEKDSMIVKKTDRKKTTINLVNYGDFQTSETKKRPIKNHSKTDKRPIKNTNNNDNNVNNENNDIYIIVEYLNGKAGTGYKASSKKTQSLIHARMQEGFTVDDFKVVIDKKCAEWLGDEKMESFLRPETLFGTKFEGYLNAKSQKRPSVKKNQFNSFPQRKMSSHESQALERMLLDNQKSINVNDDPQLKAEAEALKKKLQEKY